MIWSAVGLFGLILPAGLVILFAGNASAQSVAALAAGACAFCLMAINLFLATRPRGIEALAGGLDRLYVIHKWTGIAVLPLILLHEGVGMDLEGEIVTSGLAKTAVDVAEFVYPAFIALILISFFKRLPFLKMRRDLIPYHWWRWSHRVLGALFLAIVFHQLFVKVPFRMNDLTAQYLNAMAALGVLSLAYTQILAPFRSRGYTVAAVDRHPAATIVDLAPRGRGLRPRPGAFAVISVARGGLREPHPFTVSQIGPDGALQFSIRGLGDYTRRLRDSIQVGDKVTVEGGYGRFDYRRGPKTQLWVAGGIGITPFLAFADSLSAEEARTIRLVYCVGKAEEAVGLDRLRAAEARVPGLSVHLHVSDSDGRLTAARLLDDLPFDLTQAGFWFCGPAPMREALLSGFKEAGKRPKTVHFEEFEFR